MTARDCIKTLNERSASIFLFLLLSGDFIFIVLHFLDFFVLKSSHHLYSIEQDRGYSEIYQYLKFCWIVALLLLIAWKSKEWRYLTWGAVFMYFLADDSLQIHEQVGLLIGPNFSFFPTFGLRLQDLGELAVSATAATLLLLPLLFAYRGGPQVFRKTSQDIVLLILPLVFFGVVVDMAHIAIKGGPKVSFILGVIEDGGEMLSVSLLAWYFFLLSVRGDIRKCYLCDFVKTLFKQSNLVRNK